MITKLVSVNIEGDKHLHNVEEFLKNESPDFVCLQEVYERDLINFAKKLGMNYAFGYMCNAKTTESSKNPFLPFGLGIMSALPLTKVNRIYYHGDAKIATKYEHIFGDLNTQSFPKLVLLCDFIATTHFTWTPKGKANDVQREDLEKLLAALKSIPEFVLCGDFNAPRGEEIFAKIANLYIDNVPNHYTTSIDYKLHRSGKNLKEKKLMIDGLFTTPKYNCQNVRLVDGISDHMAIVAEIIINQP